MNIIISLNVIIF